ncbi:AAA family ATPase [Salinibacterium sp. NK8237]|uniref:AAA family ATPase n=1 Tax=Salinibacterium sp. NK8237 TaxID=2792038 RepID=UPI0018CE3F13|nr:AAA family ATPase [Salinibacterium sp. NK8237]MBH0130559.1 AAA family ATPase [Salinibacterium sp. NK8237]
MADKILQGRRIQATLELLADAQTPLNRSTVWAAVSERFPLEGDEFELNTSGTPRGETNWAFATSYLPIAGWIDKGHNAWTITDEGREALSKYANPTDFIDVPRRLHAQWRRGNKQQLERDLSERVMPQDEAQEKVIEGARLYVDRALTRGESVFVPGRQLWTEAVTGELEAHFVAAEAIPGKTFMEQVAIQLAEVSDDAKLLMAELVAFQLLPASTDSIGEQAKRARVNGILQLMEHPVLIPAEVDSVFPFGSFNPGMRMANNLGAAMTIIVNFAIAWVRIPEEERDELLTDPWTFRDWILTIPGERFPSQRHALEYLIHPAFFVSIVSNDHKELIREAFIGEIATSTNDLDRDLLAITVALQVKSGAPISYYSSELRLIWDKAHDSQTADFNNPNESAPDDDSADEPLVDPKQRTPFAVADEKLAAAVLTEPKWLQSVLDLLWRQRQVIFYGPPGTGKTFLARAIAGHISDGADPVIVQFHPSYSYEDFVEGYRPVVKEDGLVYELVPGPFLEIAKSAAKNPELNYVLVIDEINRGNIAKVFGELYFLLEYRDEKMKLLYRSEHFALPENVYIIGTMNTADRSIALLDAAMRRRFAFVELHPDEKPTAGLLDRWLDARGLDRKVGQLLTSLNASINHRDARIGPSYFMPGDGDLSEDRLREIWRYQLLPLLEEAHYGDGLDIVARFGYDAINRKAQSSSVSVTLPVVEEVPDAIAGP